MTGRPFPDYNKMTLDFGEYVHIFEDNDPSNTTKARTTPTIALNPIGNEQGGYNFMSLVTGHELDRQQWDVIIMPNHVIKAVEAMAEREKQPAMRDGNLIFEWRPGITIEGEYEEEDDEETQVYVEDEAPVNGDNNVGWRSR